MYSKVNCNYSSATGLLCRVWPFLIFFTLIFICPPSFADDSASLSMELSIDDGAKLKTSTKQTAALTTTVQGTVNITSSSGDELLPAHTFVVLEPLDSAQVFAGKADQHSIKMEGKTFEPAYLVVHPGDEVFFENEDPFRHNAFSLSGKNEFDLGSYGYGSKPGVTFKSPGLVKVYCNIHPLMAAYVIVTPSNWFTVTDDEGKFSILDVPLGKYEAWVWNVRAEERRNIVLERDRVATLDFKLGAKNAEFESHLNKEGKPYPKEADGRRRNGEFDEDY